MRLLNRLSDRLTVRELKHTRVWTAVRFYVPPFCKVTRAASALQTASDGGGGAAAASIRRISCVTLSAVTDARSNIHFPLAILFFMWYICIPGKYRGAAAQYAARV